MDNSLVKSFEEAMDKEAASCPTMEADQSPNDDMPDMRTSEDLGEQRKANIRNWLGASMRRATARVRSAVSTQHSRPVRDLRGAAGASAGARGRRGEAMFCSVRCAQSFEVVRVGTNGYVAALGKLFISSGVNEAVLLIKYNHSTLYGGGAPRPLCMVAHELPALALSTTSA